MAILYPWATKEYCLWKMSWQQLILYHNLGVEMKYGKPESQKDLLKPTDMTHSQLKALKAQLKNQYGDIDGK